MLSNTVFPEFERVEKSLPHNNPSEIHGILCGMLCVDNNLAGDVWIEQIMSETVEVSLLANSLLRKLYDVTVAQLNDGDLRFHLFLPADNIPLNMRAEALGVWCQGYLLGLGIGGIGLDQRLPEDVNEFINDVYKITRIACFETSNIREEDEVAFTEIVEYMRVGVMLLSRSLESSLADSPVQLH